MSNRGRRIALVLACLAALLFAGRWTAVVLADRWWAAELSPEAARFTTGLHLLQLTLETGGILIACSWFIGHLLILYRAIGSVQIPRQVANLEIREALTPRALVLTTVVIGAVMGVLVGSGASGWWSAVALAWHGVSYAETEPMLNKDLGLYLAQLPLWRLLHGYAMLLLLLSLGGILILYVLIGSVRWIDRRLAISDYARTHLGILLAAVALGVCWGYLLEPYEAVAGLKGVPFPGVFRSQALMSQILAGCALSAAVLSAAWAWRPRHSWLAAGWLLLVLTSVVGRMVPPLLDSSSAEDLDPRERRRLDGLAYGLTELKDSMFKPTATHNVLPAPATLWHSRMLSHLVPDSSQVLSADRGVLSVGGRPKPVWLIVHALPNGRSAVSAIADDRTALGGGPIAYQDADTFPNLQPVTRLDLSARAVRPGAPSYLVDTLKPGVEVREWPRRMVLAWALQAGELFGRLPPHARVTWELDPGKRLERLAPYVEWAVPAARLVRGELFWVTDGYLAPETFPISARVSWRGRTVGSVRAAFVGVVRAETGETHIYLRHTADALAEAWSQIARGIILPASVLPAEFGRAVWYPEELFRAQAVVLQNPLWQVGRLVTSVDSTPLPQRAWEADTIGTYLLLPYQEPDARRIMALLRGEMVDGWESLRLIRLDSTLTLPPPSVLEHRWNRFPTYEQIRDSVRGNGGEWVDGPVRYWIAPIGLGAYQTGFGLTPNKEPSLIWVSLAIGDRLGAGRSMADAYQNLLGVSAPLISANSPVTQIEDARRLLAAADSALRRGDMVAFGRAFEALRRVLEIGTPRRRN